MRICRQLDWSQVIVPSEGSGKTKYRVTVTKGAAVACTCSGFHYVGHCKHMHIAAEKVCSWIADPTSETVVDICPVCGGEVVEVDGE